MHEHEVGLRGPWGWRLLVLMIASLAAEVRRATGTGLASLNGIGRSQSSNEGE